MFGGGIGGAYGGRSGGSVLKVVQGKPKRREELGLGYFPSK